MAQGALTAAGAGEEVVPASPVFEEAGDDGPALEQVIDRRCRGSLCRELGTAVPQPSLQVGDEGSRTGLTVRTAFIRMRAAVAPRPSTR